MADEAFALSPISARSTSPTDADYEAIREAFMETSRGRWFLTEYAKRNRNADTAMVLDAVARIEQSLAATKAAAIEPEPQGPPAEELLAQVETILREARTSVVAILGEPVEVEGLTPFRRSARIIQEIAWGLRESGADIRICDLLDGQVRNINAASDALSDSGRDAVLQEIDVAILRVRQLLDDGHAAEDEPQQGVSATDGLSARETERTSGLSATAAKMPVSAVETTAAAAEPEALAAMAEIPASDMISMDTGAIDIDTAEPDVPTEVCAEAIPAVAPAVGLPDTSPALETITPVADAAIDMPAQAPPNQPSEQEALTVEQAEAMLTAVNVEASLGEHLIAQGIVAQAKAAPDLLAPIRRMSQAEKIAFFS